MNDALPLFGQGFGELDAVAFNDDIDIGVFGVQEEIAHETAGDIGVTVQSGRSLADLAQQNDHGAGKDLRHNTAEIARSFHRRPFVASKHLG